LSDAASQLKLDDFPRVVENLLNIYEITLSQSKNS
jgi:hypothetical protein